MLFIPDVGQISAVSPHCCHPRKSSEGAKNMASEKELAESQARSWYVSRNVSTGERDLDLGQILGEVHSPDGVSLEILEPVEVLASANAGTKAFAAQLSVPGLIRAKL